MMIEEINQITSSLKKTLIFSSFLYSGNSYFKYPNNNMIEIGINHRYCSRLTFQMCIELKKIKYMKNSTR
jgi:hypothetical protein